MPIVSSLYTIISPLFATYKLEEPDGKTTEPKTFFDFIKSVFTSHKVLIKILVTVAIFAAIGTNLQSVYAPALGATIVGVLFSALALNFYKAVADDTTQTPGVEPYKQAPIIKGIELMGHKTKQMINKGKKFASNVTTTAKDLLNSDEFKPFTGSVKGMTQSVNDKVNNMSSKLNAFGNKFANKTNAFNTTMNKSF